MKAAGWVICRSVMFIHYKYYLIGVSIDASSQVDEFKPKNISSAEPFLTFP